MFASRDEVTHHRGGEPARLHARFVDDGAGYVVVLDHAAGSSKQQLPTAAADEILRA